MSETKKGKAGRGGFLPAFHKHSVLFVITNGEVRQYTGLSGRLAFINEAVGIISTRTGNRIAWDQSNIDVVLAQHFERQTEIDVLIGSDRRHQRIAPDTQVGNRIFADQVPLVVEFGVHRIDNRPLGLPITRLVEILILIEYRNLHRQLVGLNTFRRKVNHPAVGTVELGIPPEIRCKGRITTSVDIAFA